MSHSGLGFPKKKLGVTVGFIQCNTTCIQDLKELQPHLFHADRHHVVLCSSWDS